MAIFKTTPLTCRACWLFWQIAIARHDLRAARADLAALIACQYLVGIFQINDLDRGAGQRQADRSGLSRAVRSDVAQHGPGLGLAVAFKDEAAGHLMPALENFRG